MHSIEDAAKRLFSARTSGKPMDRLPPSCRPESMEDAYAIQREVSRLMGPIGGWKVGQADARSEPICAPMYRADIHQSGVSLPKERFGEALIEMELAFRVRRPLARKRGPFVYDDVAAVIELVPLIEILRSRFVDFMQLPIAENVADCTASAAAIVGNPVSNWRERVSAPWSLELDIDGETHRWPAITHVSGDPVALVAWQANYLARHDKELAAGDIVTTGSLIKPLASGRRAIGVWEGAGRIEVRLE